MIKTCKNCGQKFDGRANKEFCSKKCNNEYAYRLTKNATAENSADDYNITAEKSADDYNITAEKSAYNRLNSAEYSDNQTIRQFTNTQNNINTMNDNTVSIKEYDRVCNDLDDANDTITDLRKEVEQLKDGIREAKTQNALSKRSQDDFQKLSNENADFADRLSDVSVINSWYKDNVIGDSLYSAIISKVYGLTEDQRVKMHEVIKHFNVNIRKVATMVDKLTNTNIDAPLINDIPDIDYSGIQQMMPSRIEPHKTEPRRGGFSVGFNE